MSHSFFYTLLIISYRDQCGKKAKSTATPAPIAIEIDDKLQGIAGAEITVNSMDSGMNMGDPIQVQLNGPEHEVLRDISEQVVREIELVAVKHIQQVEYRQIQ